MAGPGRPPNERDLFLFLNGCPVSLGVIVSTGAAVNNASTAVPFNSNPLGPNTNPSVGPKNFTNTLAGKTILIQATAQGVILPSTSPIVTIAGQVAPIVAGTSPGILIGALERVIMIMLPDMGWLQWLPDGAATANCFIWELL